MKRIFVDTGAWIALAEQSDVHHLSARAVAEELGRENALLITSDYVLDETVTWLRYNVSHKVAIEFIAQIMTSNVTEVLNVDEAVFTKTIEHFNKYRDQKFSFTDCSSFVLMRTHRIKQAFAFDAHFVTAGFEILQPKMLVH